MQNKLDNYDTIKLKDARETINKIYDYNYISKNDPLSRKLETLLKKINHILEEYGEK